MMEDLKNIIESLLFVAETPLTMDRFREITAADPGEIRAVLNDLADEYERRKGGFFLREVAGGFQIRTRPEYTDWIKLLLQPTPPRFSKAAMETLAIIAYKQPIIRSEIEHIRGVDSGGVLRLLLERKLIRILGRKEIPGRPLIYATTKQFLEMFDLKDLKDLPSPKEIEEFGQSTAETAFVDIDSESDDEPPGDAPELLDDEESEEPPGDAPEIPNDGDSDDSSGDEEDLEKT